MMVEQFLSLLQIVSLVCITIIFTFRMTTIVEKYILPRPKEECWGIFICIMIVIGILYFAFQHMYKKMVTPFFYKIYNL